MCFFFSAPRKFLQHRASMPLRFVIDTSMSLSAARRGFSLDGKRVACNYAAHCYYTVRDRTTGWCHQCPLATGIIPPLLVFASAVPG